MTSSNTEGKRLPHWAVLLIACLLLYAPGVFGGRPLSIHEARLPELAREMVLHQSDWLLPQSGGRPWLERPPLPHWFTAIAMMLSGRTDAVWVVRLPAALVATAIVLTGAWMARRWFGPAIGLASGLVLASSYELYQYATLAEDDIYLGGVVIACMAMFVRTEWPGENDLQPEPGRWSQTLFGTRPCPTFLFFALLGLTNLAKGPMVGALPILAATSLFLLFNRDMRRLRHYAWFWGWLLFAIIAAAWPLWALHRYPDVLNNWSYDYLGRAEGVPADAPRQWDEPMWYYFVALPLSLAPWTWATIIGFAITASKARTVRGSAERLLWCWACGGVLVLSLPARKHHHYLVPLIAPFAILGALGLAWSARRLLAHRRAADQTDRSWRSLAIFGAPVVIALAILGHKFPTLSKAWPLFAVAWLACVVIFTYGVNRARPGWLLASVLLGVIVVGGWIQLAYAGRDEATLAEAALCDQALAIVPADAPIFVNSDINSLNFFRLQYALGPRGRLLHNLSYLRDIDLAGDKADFVITRYGDRSKLESIGSAEVIAQAASARRERSPDERFTLFRVTPAADLVRYPKPDRVGVLEAMDRKSGPWLGASMSGTHRRSEAAE